MITELSEEKEKCEKELNKIGKKILSTIKADTEKARDSLCPDLCCEGDHDLDVLKQRKSKLKEKLLEIEKALSLAAEGKRGICQDCGESIDPRRLEKVPHATLCVRCKQEQEDCKKAISGFRYGPRKKPSFFSYA